MSHLWNKYSCRLLGKEPCQLKAPALVIGGYPFGWVETDRVHRKMVPKGLPRYKPRKMIGRGRNWYRSPEESWGLIHSANVRRMLGIAAAHEVPNISAQGR